MERDMNYKQKEGENIRSTEVDVSRPSWIIYEYKRPFRIESKGKVPRGNIQF
jgi:hypothetical protein